MIIPLAVHIVYNKQVQNISDAQIKSQIDTLNQDYSRTNPDAANTPSAFLDVAVDTGIQFCLAKVIRTQTNVKEFTDNAVKSCSTGGSDALDTTKYMNIWVCRLGSGLLGYAEFPNTEVSKTYGVVMNYEAFGNMGTARSPYNKGRTLTHEISHCLNVRHVFEEGVPETQCSKTDYCLDIPTQKEKNFGCPKFPHTEDCAINAPGVMFMNYMDYVDDACMNIFTKDQAARMNATLSIAPYDKLAVAACAPTQNTTESCNGVQDSSKFLEENLTSILIAAAGVLLLIVLIMLLLKRAGKLIKK
jgi:hypothetical protein